MIKKIFFLLVVFLFVFLIFSKLVYSQETPSDLQPPYVMECVKVKAETNKWPGKIENVNFSGTCSSPNGCDVGICEGNNCTVFDLEKDTRYFGKPGENLPDVRVNGPNPHKFPSGNFEYLKGQIIGPKDHTNYGVFAVWEPQKVNLGGQGNDSTQKLQELQMIFSGDNKDCVSVYWDPYGRVFDAISLEPLGKGEARVSLYDQAGNFVNTPSNNAIIDNLGKYNIYIVNDGWYTLKVDSLINHEFVSIKPNPGYIQLYEKIFKAGDPPFFESQTNPQRYDIPVKPKSTPYHRDPEIIFKSQNLIWSNGEEYNNFNFRVSHPMTKVITNLKDSWTCQQTNSQYTDKEGFCLIKVKIVDIPQEGIDIKFKLDKKYYPLQDDESEILPEISPISKFFKKILSFLFKYVNAQKTIKINDVSEENDKVNKNQSQTIHFSPILRYIEGYAYDKNGNVIPRAKVNVKLLNNSVFYTTNADERGFFVIYKKNLPPLEFYLQFIDPKTGNQTSQTTSQFVNLNKKYLDSNQINLISETKNNQPIRQQIIESKNKDNINQKNNTNKDINKIDKNNYQNQTSTPLTSLNKEKNSLFNKYILILFILFVLFVSLIGIVFYIKKNHYNT